MWEVSSSLTMMMMLGNSYLKKKGSPAGRQDAGEPMFMLQDNMSRRFLLEQLQAAQHTYLGMESICHVLGRCLIYFCPVDSSSLSLSALRYVNQTMEKADMEATCFNCVLLRIVLVKRSMPLFLPHLPQNHRNIYYYTFTPLQCHARV